MPVVVNNSDSSGGGAAGGGENITIDAVVAELQQTHESIKNIADVIGKDTVKTNLILPFIDAFTSVFASSLSAMSTPAVSAPAGGDIAAAKAANLQEWFFFGGDSFDTRTFRSYWWSRRLSVSCSQGRRPECLRLCS